MPEKLWAVTLNSSMASGVLIRNTLHLSEQVPVGTNQDSADTVADNAWTHIGTEYRACCPTTLTIHSLTTREVLDPSSTDIPAAGIHGVNLAGTNVVGSSDLPVALCPLLDLHTDAAIRSGHGWLFMPPMMNSTLLNGGKWTSDVKNTIEAFGTKVAQNYSTGVLNDHDYEFRVYSLTRDKRGDDKVSFNIVGATMRDQPAWLRSRLTIP